ncbi:YfhO family protein (plasmid) [Pedobacter sp. BS3]|uniref:YfhO family protein n=1 Tax=Pedobacter sp. BS3 TaxID=2567937 RepID=UPI0011EBB1F8|nr:YfhO family protein [Pedobacter sp. BS3]TZF86285.1 YfhO family protein [Pedobacter sp. BS3]
MNNWFQRNGVHLIITGIFIALCFVYFSPALQGKSLYQNDVLQAQAMQKEIMDFKAKDGKGPLWTNAMFGGMPAYQIWVQFPKNVTTYIISFFKTVFPTPVDTVLIYLLGAYLLFCVLRINPWLAAAGAIAVAFSSYNFIIIEAGHSNKAMAIAFFAPLLAGILLTLQGKRLTGAALTALFLALEIRANHIQMTYYLFIALLILIGIELYHAIKAKVTADFLKSVGSLAIAVMVAVGVNAGLLWTTYEYGQHSIRGKSNLTVDKSEPKNGLDKEYAYAWSQGVGESITFLVPNAYGGSSSSQALDENSAVAKLLQTKGATAEQAAGFAKQMPTYWGDKPFTSGPYYFGAIVCFLFVLGLFVVKSRIKWWILAASLLSLFLSFGKNFPLISDLFFNYFPLYNKFRAVESALVIADFLVPVLAVMAVSEIAFNKPEPKKLQKQLQYSFYITGGIALIILLLPSLFFSFKPAGNEQFVQQLMQATGGDRGFADAISNALVQDRISMARMDAFRSLIFIALGAACLWAFMKQKLKLQTAFLVIGALILVDMWTVDRRYLNNNNFVDSSELNRQFQPREVDQLILRDQSLDYRVLDLTIPTFSSATASYFHKTVGGYHAAKLKRFQEVIDKQFNNSINEDVLDMLNTKYVITSDKNGQSQRIENRSTTCGNAWFVENINYVNNADEEMAGINSFNPKKEAIVDKSFKSIIDAHKLAFSPSDKITLTDYRPDHLTYEYSSGHDALAVFAEIWYDKGWNAYVDGEKIPHLRANYILRAAVLPGGNHKLEFKFEPASYYAGENISLAASILLIAGLGFAAYQGSKKNKNKIVN